MIYIFIAMVSTLSPPISQETVERKEIKIELFELKEVVSTDINPYLFVSYFSSTIRLVFKNSLTCI